MRGEPREVVRASERRETPGQLVSKGDSAAYEMFTQHGRDVMYRSIDKQAERRTEQQIQQKHPLSSQLHSSSLPTHDQPTGQSWERSPPTVKAESD